LAHMPCWRPWSFYPKTVEITCAKWNAYKLPYRFYTTGQHRLAISTASSYKHFITIHCSQYTCLVIGFAAIAYSLILIMAITQLTDNSQLSLGWARGISNSSSMH
jgi:hypothetical protein